MLKIPLTLRWNKNNHASLLNESMPQLGVSVFSSVIARFDWILLGFFSTKLILAEYSFAYKVFEMASLPLLVIAPILIPRFTRLFHPINGQVTPEKTVALMGFLRMELVIASLSCLLLNLIWAPVIDQITQGKYGEVNNHTVLVLSACLPFIYLNNFLWTVNFAKGRMKMIFWVFALTFAVNMIADLALIPFYGGEGAAFGYLLAMISQSVAFLYMTKISGLTGSALSVLIAPACAFFVLFATKLYIGLTWSALAMAIPVFILLLLLTRQVKKGDWQLLKRISSI
jgi:O-antigen/teichoic acid export membrane protein